MRPIFLALLAFPLLVLLLPVTAHALPALGGAPENEAAAPAESRTIAQDRRAGEDGRIERRIRGIFAELPAFGRVGVTVEGGVVSLEGVVANEPDIARAEAIAGRIEGVVTVENGLVRDSSVASGIGALAGLSDRVEEWIARLPLIAIAAAVALLITALGYLVAGLGGLWRRVAPNPFLAEIIASAIRFAAAIIGVVVALEILGAGTLLGAVLGGAGVIGIALGFAMRDTIENYVASLMLSVRQPFRANDHVVIDGREGRVIRLTSRATILMTLEGNHLRIPNAQVFKAVILNYTRNPQRRFDFELGIDADDDPRAAIAVGIAALARLPFVLSLPEPTASIREVGDSNVVIWFMGWIDQRQAAWLKSRSLAIAAVKQALEEGGFALPEPIYRIRLDPRSGPLPIGRAGAEVPHRTPEREAAIAPADAAQSDVRPDDDVGEMVEHERRTPSAGAADLLDPRRPVE